MIVSGEHDLIRVPLGTIVYISPDPLEPDAGRDVYVRFEKTPTVDIAERVREELVGRFGRQTKVDLYGQSHATFFGRVPYAVIFVWDGRLPTYEEYKNSPWVMCFSGKPCSIHPNE